MAMAQNLRVDCERLDGYFHPEIAIIFNRWVTTGETPKEQDSKEDGEAGFLVHQISLSLERMAEKSAAFEIQAPDDFFQVRDRGHLESLHEWQLPRKCRDDNSLDHMVSYLLTDLASSHCFGNGNKRTAFLCQIFFLMLYQIRNKPADNGLSLVLPRLSKEYVSILEDISMGEKTKKDVEEVKSFLEPVMEQLEQNIA